MKQADETPGVIAPPPLIVLGTLAFALLLDGHFRDWPPVSPVVVAAGITFVVAGLVPIALALGLFRRAGTPAPPWQPSSALVRGGIYRFTRNPMYLGMLLFYVGLALALHSRIALLLFVPLFVVMDRFVVRREEAYLRRRFGSPYEQYLTEVRRWL